MKEKAKDGVTIFLSSHLLHEVEQICTHVTIINKGIALASGTPKQISKKVKASVKVEAEVDKLSKTVLNKVKELPFVKGISVDDKKILIDVETRDDVRSEVSQAITAGGGIVISMNLKGESLEDVFMEVLAELKEEEATK